MAQSNSKQSAKLLIVDDDTDLLTAARILLKKHFSTVVTETDPEQLPVLLARDTFDVILLDMNFTLDAASGHEGLLWLDKVKKLSPKTIVIMMTAYGDTELAIAAMKKGATDFVLKPWQNDKLLATLTAAAQLSISNQEVSKLRSRQKIITQQQDKQFQDFLGQSSAMEKVFSSIEKAAVTDANVLILGESGTGKELVARALHRQSNRAGQSFINVDMGTISDNLFESELFGHKKGAFTDARQDRMGRFEAADKGSLFLDEIGNLPTPLQGKLLTAIQQKSITPVGSNQPVQVDIRLICATNANLLEQVEQQLFRQDLLYRINTVEINLPPLRQREDDIFLLAEHYLNHYQRKYKKTNLSLDKETRYLFKQYQWPGNVRELQHAIERAVIMSESTHLRPEDFPICHSTAKNKTNFDTFNLEQIEISTIKASLEHYQGNVSHAAKALGLTRTSLYRRMEKYAL
ncbi:sigma-54-dependent transcriptional regulator [Aliikangiella coralliicola]|uniref:Sigma-54-dependent Fis family transcriptional regulator n=1 Tax=Aliikangiella coralliicola TaxID=2592383 RepID=A0A545UIS2_9GAMM|nr:sigma-54 dependent transcriptional regulator [Aliikangiella coralliicola]TQV89365.1 sigma-54-dependent Fis family transcriptional regulator [Aliikangiella coralliicola]